MTETVVSVVVVPREGFRQAPARLAQLLDLTDTAFRLVYVDGNAPSRVARRIRYLIRRHGGTLIRTDRYLRPTHARNLGFREVDTRYTVFLDNDVVVTPGWLGALVQCAEETGAAFVSPVICIGGRMPPVVHVAGGVNRVVEDGGRRRLLEIYAHAHRPLPEVLAEIQRQPTTMAEFHAILVRTDSLRALGGLDERCPTAFEHNDLCLSFAARGAKGWLEPDSIVDYVPDRAAAPANAPYHLVRWCRAWIDESLGGFCAKWALERDDPALAADLASLHGRRRRPARYVRGLARRVAGHTGAAQVDRWTDRWIDRLLHAVDQRQPLEVDVFRGPGRRA
jgi:GT2 family glycosyltransferase